MQEFLNTNTGKTIRREAPKESEAVYDGKMMIAEIDTHGVITYTNRKLREMLNYEKEDIVGLPYAVSFHPDMPESICRQAFDLAGEGKIWAGYAKTITRNGEYFWTAVCVQPKYEMDKSITGFIIRKKPATDVNLEEVAEEYSKLASLKMGECNSEFCGELHFSS